MKILTTGFNKILAKAQMLKKVKSAFEFSWSHFDLFK